MKKIISLFMRDYEGTRLVYDEIVPGAEWVVAGEGVATRKYDGTAVMVRDGKLYKRYDAKLGRTPPAGFEPCQEPDPVTGHHPGWVPVGDDPGDKWFRALDISGLPDGTYEACGQHFQGDPEHYEVDTLIPHGCTVLDDVPRTFDALKAYFAEHVIEGIVWHRGNGDMAKIKARDFGLKWPR